MQISNQPESIDLLSAYPNPFNESTTIVYTIKEPTEIKLALFNITGSLIKTLITEYKDPGTFHYNLNAADLASGTYFCILDTETQITTTNLIPVR